MTVLFRVYILSFPLTFCFWHCLLPPATSNCFLSVLFKLFALWRNVWGLFIQFSFGLPVVSNCRSNLIPPFLNVIFLVRSYIALIATFLVILSFVFYLIWCFLFYIFSFLCALLTLFSNLIGSILQFQCLLLAIW